MRSNKIITIPNILSVFRIILVPAFVITFFSKSLENHYIWAAVVFGLSGLSDIADGFIARKFNMISNVGKVLDPVADKLTQATVVVCVSVVNHYIIPLVIILFTKEILMLIGALKLVKAGNRPIEAKWWGKFSTVVLFVSLTLFVLHSVYSFLPDFVIIGLVILSGISIIFSLLSYYPLFRELQQPSNKAS